MWWRVDLWGNSPRGRAGGSAVDRPELEYYAPLSVDASPVDAYALYRDGSVMAGFADNPWFSLQPVPLLWTKEWGRSDLDAFVRRQGTSIEQYGSLWTPMGMSDDGTVMTGWGFGFQGWAGWVLQMPKVVCLPPRPGGARRGAHPERPIPDDLRPAPHARRHRRALPQPQGIAAHREAGARRRAYGDGAPTTSAPGTRRIGAPWLPDVDTLPGPPSRTRGNLSGARGGASTEAV